MPNKISLDDKYALDVERAYLTGIEALVRLPIVQQQRDTEAGLHTAGFVSGYRGSPVGTVDQSMWKAARRLEQHYIHFQPGVNEDLAATAVWGTQQANLLPGAKYDGVFAMWYGKGPGVDRSMDVFKHANAFGTTQYGGVLAVAGDDHACKSSTVPHQSEPMLIGAAIPVLNPADVQEVLDYGIIGWALSRYSGCWVGLKAITENMDSAISAALDPQRIQIQLPQDFTVPRDGLNAQWPTTPLAQEKLLYQHRLAAVRAFAHANHLNQITLDSPHARLGIVTTGKSHLDVLEALECLGIDRATANEIGLRIYKVGMSWPLEPVATRQFANGLQEILVVEEKRNIVEDQMVAQLYRLPGTQRPLVVGERDEHGNSLITTLGELTPHLVARVIGERINQFYQSKLIQQRLAWLAAHAKRVARTATPLTRTPYFCSGCPHNTSTRIPQGSIGMAGIGCHYMVKWMNRNTETFTQMGGEGASWIGMAPFTTTPHVFQNLGDGTYFHSGILAIRASLAAGVNITYKVLFNDAVAMTGGQAVDGSLTLPELVAQLQAEGVKRLAVVAEDEASAADQLRGQSNLSLHPRRDLEAVQCELREIPGTTVIIYDQTCAIEKRRRRKRGQLPPDPTRIFINADVCEGCGDCSVASNCLSVLPKQTELGEKRQIDQNACNQDFSCLDGFCPSFVSVTGATLRTAKQLPDTNLPEWLTTALPAPQLPSLHRPWNTLITGIGGTGVLTLGSLLAMAAHIEGKGCSTLHQTGLAQKFGAVVSHVRIANSQQEIHAVRISEGSADVLLGCDLVVATMPESLARLHIERSHAVVNTDESPTADFIHQPNYHFPGTAMRQSICQHSGGEQTDFVNATRIVRRLLGDSISSNLFLLGFAYQRGLIPLRAAAIQQAITLNQVAVELNQQAFVWGRRASINLAQVEKLVAEDTDCDAGAAHAILTELDEIIDWRYAVLTDYQNTQYAERYRALVERSRQRENAVLSGLSGASQRTKSAQADCQTNNRDHRSGAASTNPPPRLTLAVAHNYFKLLAYKDEYEIARLYSDGKFIARLKQQFCGPFKLNFHLAVPLLSRKHPVSGHRIKRTFPAVTLKFFSFLARLRYLRGTRLDVFGYQTERRQERQLIAEYEHDIAHLLAKLTSHNYATAVEFAALPQMIKGFGHIKSANIKHYHTRKTALLQKFQDAT